MFSKMAMQHMRQAPGRDIHKHFSLAPARSHTITASNKASATATRNPPPHPVPYKTGPKLAMRRRGHHTCHSTLSLPRSCSRPHTSNHEWAQTVKGGETPPACAPPLSGAWAPTHPPPQHRISHFEALLLATNKSTYAGGMNGEVGPRSGHAPPPSLHPAHVSGRAYVAPEAPPERGSPHCRHTPLPSALSAPVANRRRHQPPRGVDEPGAGVGRKGHPLFQPRHHPTRSPPACCSLRVAGSPAAGTRSRRRGSVLLGKKAAALRLARVLRRTVMLDAPLPRDCRHG